MHPLQFLKGDATLPLLALEHSALVLGGLLVYLLLTRIGQQRRPPASAVAWVLLIALFPYFGLPLFLLFGTRKFARPLRKPPVPSRTDLGNAAPRWATGLLAAMHVPPPSLNPTVLFHENGEASRQALFQLLESAQRQVDLCSFILAADEAGLALAKALRQCARRGVKVRLLLDALGDLRHPRRHVEKLRRDGIDVRWFMPLLHNPLKGRTNLRNHRKMVIADGQRFWSGGRNFAAEYFTGSKRRPAWVDLSFVVEGPLARQAQVLFERDWHAVNGDVRVRHGFLPPEPAQPGTPAQLVPSGPDLPDDTLHDLLLTAAYQARHRLIAVTPYFVPDDALLSAWCLACRRGIDFTLLLPRRSNHRLADVAREPALRELAAAGARIRLYPGMLHAKAVIVDDQLALCGSANLDGRSLFLNFELMTAFYGAAEIAWLEDWSGRHVARASPYRPRAPGLGRSLLEGLVRTVGYQL
ncbi:MAG: PLDc N-terminal domain-containing protein [Betaproteobacteria bacterium]|nr:PLDc N-terminal domain-containing protein [Betaproteobacteria bacterium]